MEVPAPRRSLYLDGSCKYHPFSGEIHLVRLEVLSRSQLCSFSVGENEEKNFSDHPKSFCLLDDSSIVPWLLSFKRGTALEEQGNKIVIKETGYFFIYGQVRELNSPQHLTFVRIF